MRKEGHGRISMINIEFPIIVFAIICFFAGYGLASFVADMWVKCSNRTLKKRIKEQQQTWRRIGGQTLVGRQTIFTPKRKNDK